MKTADPTETGSLEILSDATPEAGLASGELETNRERWREVQDELLRWTADPSLITGDDLPVPDPDLIKSAIDFVYDHRREGSPAPTAFGPAGEGGIAFEWRNGSQLITIEIVCVGVGELTELDGGRIVSGAILRRDPTHRGWFAGDSS